MSRTLLALLCTASGVLAAAPAHASGNALPAVEPLADEDAQHAAALVAAEDRRLTEVRTVVALARWQGRNWKTPYRLSTGSGYTLVLTPRSEPYTVTDLLQLAPQTFLRMSDGSFLLSEHVVLSSGATLRLEQPGGLTVRLASSPRGFVSIVSLGGELQIAGEEQAPVRIQSWNADAAEPDTEQADGRAYVRAQGGQFVSAHAELSDLGFWSGRTGGLALTGTDRPNTGAIEALGRSAVGTGGVPSLLEGVTTQPAGPLQPGQSNPTLDYTVPAYDYVSTSISDTVIDGGAYGLFITGANGVHISDSRVQNSLIDGLVLHRHVTHGVIERTTSVQNMGDGISLDRATTGITINDSTASHNERNGVSMSGRPLAAGPSATGATTISYGGNSVANSTFTGNGRYGIEVVEGFDTGVQNNRVEGGDMGIVVRGPAHRITVSGNEVRDSTRHGIALTGGVADSSVTGNVVDGAGTGVYLRDANARVRGNTVQGATSHGVSLVGAVAGSDVALNILSGSGASALDSTRATGAFTAERNAVDAWDDTTPWYYWFKKLLQPMTALWLIIATLVLTSAFRGRHRKHRFEHPYAHQMAHQEHLAVPAPRVIDLREDQQPALTGAR